MGAESCQDDLYKEIRVENTLQDEDARGRDLACVLGIESDLLAASHLERQAQALALENHFI